MWKDIINYEDIYEINEYGEVRNKLTNKIVKYYLNNKEYKCIVLSRDSKKEKFLIHRLVAIHFLPNIENYPIVLHKDNNKINTHYSNLKWGTYSENNSQAIRDGLNKLPKPDNRKHYELYNEETGECYLCFGGKDVLEKIGFGNESYLRNTLFRNNEIPDGRFKGFKIRRKFPESPIIFINQES